MLFAGVERAKPGFRVADSGFDGSNLGGDVDQLRIELAAVLTDRRDLGLELLLKFSRALLLCARRFQLLLPLLDGIRQVRARPAAPVGDLRRCGDAGRGEACGKQR